MDLSVECSAEEIKVFMEEGGELIQLLDEDIIKLEREGENLTIIQEIFRAAHTLKGSSAMLGHKRMADVTHAMETLLDMLRNRKLQVNSLIVDALLYGLDAIKSLIQEVVTRTECDIDIKSVIDQLAAATNNHSPDDNKTDASTSENKIGNGTNLTLNKNQQTKLNEAVSQGLTTLKVKVALESSCEWKAVRCLQALMELEHSGKVIASLPTAKQIENENVNNDLMVVFCTEMTEEQICKMIKSVPDVHDVTVLKYAEEDTSSPQIQKANIGQKQYPSQVRQNERANATGQVVKPESLQSVRVDVKVLDGLMNTVEELVIDRSRIGQVGKMLDNRYPDDNLVNELSGAVNHLMKVIKGLQQDIMRVRMVPISVVFNKFPRLVRDLAQKQQKQVNFIIKGEDTELDRTIIEQISDPIVHLLRNAIDHGVEIPSIRKDQNKPAGATVILSAYQQEEHIFITLQDDGAGIDPAKIKTTAINKGFLTRESAELLSDQELENLIFAPGFSTASTVTDVSGRGVGMDIVKTNIERLKGSVSLQTEKGKGTLFTIKLPLTLAVFQGLMVSIRNENYIVPLASVTETLRVDTNKIYSVMNNEMMKLRDEIIPLVKLDTILGHTNGVSSNNKYYIIVASAEGKRIGMIVDRLLDQQEYVIKPVVAPLGKQKCISGATILGNGNVALILDVPSIVKLVKAANN